MQNTEDSCQVVRFICIGIRLGSEGEIRARRAALARRCRGAGYSSRPAQTRDSTLAGQPNSPVADVNANARTTILSS
jgi:hypothetical protein